SPIPYITVEGHAGADHRLHLRIPIELLVTLEINDLVMIIGHIHRKTVREAPSPQYIFHGSLPTLVTHLTRVVVRQGRAKSPRHSGCHQDMRGQFIEIV